MTSFPSPASGRTTSGCISRILRRILCFSNLPLRSFHHFNNDQKIAIDSCSSTPGLVARLMGLESLPFEETPMIQKSISRQRIIFPPYQELQDDNFFILSFERRKSGKKSAREKQRRRRRKKENPVFSEGVLEFEIRGGKAGDFLKPKIRANSVELGYEAEADSENSSPSSVLEFVGFQEPSSSGEVSRLANSKLRRPLSVELEKKVININNAQNYAETWEEMGDLAGMEMMKSSWFDKNRNCLTEIGKDLELCILDQLLNEMLINLQIF